MKTWITLAGVVGLMIGSAAQAAEPLQLSDAALDNVTAGKWYNVSAGTLSGGVGYSGGGVGGGSIVDSAWANGGSLFTPSVKTITLEAAAEGQSTASGTGPGAVVFAFGGGFVTFGVSN